MMNVPNKISITRICLMPVFILFFLLPYTWSKFLALGIFILAAISDCIDGYIARKYNLVTDLGKFLDPIADKLLATTGLIMFIVGTDPIIPMPYGIIVMFIMILRDYEVTGIRQIGQLKGVIIAADKVAKIKANFLYATLVYGLLISCLKTIEVVNSSAFLTYFTFVFYIFVGITTALIIISGLVYLINNVSVFKENITNQNKKDNDIKLNKNTTKSDNKSSKKITSKTQKANNKQIKDKKTN